MQKKLPNGQIVYEEDYSCIVQPQNGKGGIFIGNLEAAQNLKTLRKYSIKAILTAAKGIDLNHPKSEIPHYLQVPGEDREGFDMARFFTQGVNFIKDALQNTSIMVHCLAGVSRSVCLVLAYFIKYRGFSYDEAYNLVKIKRSIIHPNQGFIAQLRKYENQERGSRSPTKYQINSSPTKKRYEYYYQDPSCRSPQTNYRFQPQVYISPSKRSNIQSYVPTYQSPSKKDFKPSINQSYTNSTNKLYSSPVKIRPTQQQVKKTLSLYQPPSKLGIQRMQSYQQSNDLSTEIYLRHISPQRKRYMNNQDHRNRSNSILNVKQPKIVQKNISNANYERSRHTSTVQLSQQLDKKIAAIRQKYSEYAKNELIGNRKTSIRQSQPRVNNFMDENQLGIRGNLGIKKINSQFQGNNSKTNGHDLGLLSNYSGRVSTVGLGIRKINSLRQGY